MCISLMAQVTSITPVPAITHFWTFSCGVAVFFQIIIAFKESLETRAYLCP